MGYVIHLLCRGLVNFCDMDPVIRPLGFGLYSVSILPGTSW
jgi:hypothetical protein